MKTTPKAADQEGAPPPSTPLFNTHFPANLTPIHTERHLHLMSIMITQIMWVLRLEEAYPH